MNFTGLIIGAATFLCIGVFHPLVIKAEYHFGIRTAARVEKTYLVTVGRSVTRMVKYYFYVGDSLYYGHTSLPKSEWNQLQPHVQFDIVYEKGNPNNSNWARYYKDKQ